jgi:hypothetical protein
LQSAALATPASSDKVRAAVRVVFLISPSPGVRDRKPFFLD